MSKRAKPPEGQKCECVDRPTEAHAYGRWGYEDDPWSCCDRPPEDHDWPNHGSELRRVYWEKNGRMCYGWWCAGCRSWLSEDDDGEGWPTGDDGRFMASVHCQMIPGLD